MRHSLSLLLSLVFLSLITSCKKDSKSNVNYEALTGSAFDFSDGYYRKGYSVEDERYKLLPVGKSAKLKEAKVSGLTFEDGVFELQISGLEMGAETKDAASKAIAQSENGQHVKLVLDNSDAVEVSSTQYSAPLSDGQHYILAAPARSYHEISREKDACYTTFVDVKEGKIVHEWDLPEPTLFFVSPKGPIVGADAKRVLLDFYTANCTIGKDAFIELYINGEYKYLNKDEPMYLEGLPFGQNTIAMKLVDHLGEQIAGKQTAIRKVVILERDPTAEE